jgi:hypothetical protein
MIVLPSNPAVVTNIRSALLAAGFPPVPVQTGGKRPVGFAWVAQAQTGNLPLLTGTALNTGVLCNGLRSADMDIDDEQVATACVEIALRMLGPAPEKYRSNSSRCTLVYRAAEGEPQKRTLVGTKGKIEILGKGQQFVAFGTHPSGAELLWRDRDLYEITRDDLTAITEDHITLFFEEVAPILGAVRKSPEPSMPAVRHEPAGASEIEELLSYCPADIGYHEWVAVLMALHSAGASVAVADQWSARGGDKYPGSKEIEKKWRSFKRSGITIATLAHIASQYGADLSAIAIKHNRPEGYDPIEAAAAARRLIENHDGSLADAQTGEIVELHPAASQPSANTDFPPGLVGTIAQWIVDTARRPQPELALGAALTIVGTVAGRQFCGPTKSGTHLYVLGLAPTGTGKDHPLQQISRIMAAAKLTAHLGPSEFISMPAVIKFLMRKPLSVCPMDEFGGFMKRINSRRASGFEASISKIIRTMWSCSFAPYPTPEWAGKDSQTIYSPAMSLYGASTPEQFYSSMEGSSIEDGTLNRFLLLGGRERPDERDPEYDASIVPEIIIDNMRTIYCRSGELAMTYRNDALTDPASVANRVRVLPWCGDGAHKRYNSFSAEIERIMRKDVGEGAFYARSAEMALRIATIVAIGRMNDDQVRKSDIEFGIDIAYRSAKLMAAGAGDYMADNENQANAQKVIRCLKARGGRLVYRDLLQSLKNSIRARDLRDLLGSMCEAGQLERQEVKPPTGPSTFWYQVQS